MHGRVLIIHRHAPAEQRSRVELVVQPLERPLEVPGAGAPVGVSDVPAADAFQQVQQGLPAAGLDGAVGVDARAVVGLRLALGVVGEVLRWGLCGGGGRGRAGSVCE